MIATLEVGFWDLSWDETGWLEAAGHTWVEAGMGYPVKYCTTLNYLLF